MATTQKVVNISHNCTADRIVLRTRIDSEDGENFPNLDPNTTQQTINVPTNCELVDISVWMFSDGVCIAYRNHAFRFGDDCPTDQCSLDFSVGNPAPP